MPNRPVKSGLAELFSFFLPLALTNLMMSGGTPIVNAGIARRPDPVDGLAVFAVAFAFTVFINSLCFGMEPAIVAMAKGPRSFKRVATFSLGLGFALSALELIVALSPLSEWVFKGFFGLSDALADQAALTLVVFSPLPILLTLRSVGRGTLTAISRTAMVGWGTLFRLLAMIIVVVAGAFGLPVSGSILGAIAFLAGVATESLIVAVSASRHRDDLPGDNDDDVAATYAGILRFVSPLLVSGLFTVGINSVMNAILTRTDDANVAVSVFSVIRSVTWFFASTMIAYHQLVIARAHSPEERLRVRSFAVLVTGIMTFLLALMAYTPAGEWVVRELIGVDGEVLEKSLYTLLFVPLIPLGMGLRSYLRGMAIRDRLTPHVLASSIFALLIATLTGLGLMHSFKVGAMVALMMWLFSQVGEALLMILLRLRNRRLMAARG